MPWIELSNRQQRVVGAAVTLLAGIFVVAAVIGLFALAGWMLNFFADVFMPVIAAMVLATMAKPYYEILLRRVRRPAFAVALVLLSFALPFVLLFVAVGPLVLDQIVGFIHSVPGWVAQLNEYIKTHTPKLHELWRDYGVDERLKNLVHQRGEDIARGIASAGIGFSRAVAGLFGWVVMPVYFVFILQARTFGRSDVEKLMPFLKPETRADASYLIHEFFNILIAFFRGQLVIALAQGVLYGVGFKLVGLQYGLVIGFIMGFLNVIPYLGVLVGLGIALPTAFLQDGGGMPLVAMIGVVFVIVQCIEAYVLTPRIMGKHTGLHPMAIIFAIFFWGTALGGILGMILAIPLTAFLVVFWRLLKSKYIKEVV